jgi:hypothetical protein
MDGAGVAGGDVAEGVSQATTSPSRKGWTALRKAWGLAAIVFSRTGYRHHDRRS